MDEKREQPALTLQELRFAIHHAQILNGVTFDVSRGETVGVIGPNGSGKTTLFNCINGFYLPTAGKVLFQEREITRMPPFQRAELGLGRVFQNFGIFREMTVLENMVTALEGRQPLRTTFFPWAKQNRKNRERALELLGEVQLAEKAHLKAGSLSGGQMRLLEIMRTFAFGAELFLLDEPTAGVSPKMKEDVAELVRKLQNEKKTILIIEHDIRFIEKFCERIIVLDSGRVLLDDTPEKVKESPLLQEIYFGKRSPSSGLV
ncbi:ABC transporter ATP-binding protein [bacterium]|nr:ABC transporter ATP-binding protein [bacterium]